jgi:hypothetical protein
VADALTGHGFGEPMSMLEGISIWPTVFLRAMSSGLGIWLVFYTLGSLETDLNRRRKEMCLPKPCFQLWRKHSLVARWLEMASLLWFRPDTDAEQHPNDPAKNQNSEPTLNNQMSESVTQTEKIGPKRPFNRLWMTYCYYGQPHWRLARAAVGTLAMMALWLVLANIFGEPTVPARGPIAHQIYRWVTIFDVVITLLLIFLVVDATLFSRSVVIHLTAVESHWPGELVDGYKERFHLGRTNLEDWFDMRFVADRTRCITRLIYFPFVMLALLMVSQSPILDNYAFTPTLVITQVVILAIIIGSVVSLRHAAEEARNSAIERLSEKIMAANPNTGSQLEKLRAEVRDMQAGAFAPPLSQPIVKAVLLPLVSYGGTWLVQLYALPGL